MNSLLPGNMFYEEKDDRVDDTCERSDFSSSDTEDGSTDHHLNSDINKLLNTFLIGISDTDANNLYQ